MLIKYYFNTIKYSKISQIFWRIYYKILPTPLLITSNSLPLRIHHGNWIQPITKNIKMIGENEFVFLNKPGKLLEESTGWNNSKYSKLWLYNLHYFDDLNCKDSANRYFWHRQLIEDWISRNPMSYENGWEPYPISLRIVNWIKWSLAGNDLESVALNSLAIQSRYLLKRLEYHLLGNHLFANAKALIYAGLFFYGDEADKWFSKGQKILEQQLSDQILNDGGNFELSPMYHAIFLEDLLDVINIYNYYEKTVPKAVTEIVNKMLLWLQCTTHPNGELSLFNDSANGVAASTDQLQKYAKDLEFTIEFKQQPIMNLNDSGYIAIQSGNFSAILDVADVKANYIPGHTHADTLSFECSIFQQKVIVNSGTSIYGNSVERLRQRGTAAHSTLVIDETNSSEVWGGFRVADRARIIKKEINQTKDKIIIAASHDGYKKLYGKPIHHRTWALQCNELVLTDKVTGNGDHKIEVIYYLAPEIMVDLQSESELILLINGYTINMKFIGDDYKLEIQESTYHPEFGLSIPNKKVVASGMSQLPWSLKTSFIWKVN